MEKRYIVDLIRYHVENNDAAFRAKAYEIIRHYQEDGDYDIVDLLINLLSGKHILTTQMFGFQPYFLDYLTCSKDPLLVSSAIEKDIRNILNTISSDIGCNRYLLYGSSGTGKTEACKQISRILNISLYEVNYNNIIDFQKGRTEKNILNLFDEIKTLGSTKIIILFDNVYTLINNMFINDSAEKESILSTLINELDKLNENIIILATTNKPNCLNKSFMDKFYGKVDFDRYDFNDLVDIAMRLFDFYANKTNGIVVNKKLLKKIFSLMGKEIKPGEIKYVIKNALASSKTSGEFGYMNKIYQSLVDSDLDINILHKKGFSLREIEMLTDIPKSTIARKLSNK